MGGNRSSVFFALLSLALFVATANASAGSSGNGGIGGGNGMDGGHGIDLGSGGASGLGFAATHSIASAIATPGRSRLGAAAGTLGPIRGADAPYSSTIGPVDARSIGGNMRVLDKGVTLSYRGGIRAIDPDLDMTKIGLGDTRSGPRYGKPTIDDLDRDLKKFDPQPASGVQSKDEDGRPAMRNGNRRTLTKQQQAALAEQQALSQQEFGPVLTTIGAGTPLASTPFNLSRSTLSTASPVTVSPDTSLSTASPPSPPEIPTTTNQIEDTSAVLSTSDVSSLRTLFFPGGAPPSALVSTQSLLGVGLSVGSTLSRDISLDPLPDVALSSADAANLGYVYDGQTIVIADYNTREVVAVVSKAS